MKSREKTEYGDFQTPPDLAYEVCALLQRLGIDPDIILEPTVGQGAFLEAAADIFPKAELRGWDINGDYVRQASAHLEARGAASRSTVRTQDFFTHDWNVVLNATEGVILVLGNPPWVTNAGVAAINGTNLPAKENFMGLRGLAARTGKANFDISEWMLIRLLQAIGHRPAILAMLCKTATARKVLRHTWQNDGRIEQARIYRIDAAKHFAAAVDACLLVVSTGTTGRNEADVFPSLAAMQTVTRFGLVGKEWVADLDAYGECRHLDGLCPFQWRSGVKHDCAEIMELRAGPNEDWINKPGEILQLESRYVFPFLKCSDLANSRIEPQRGVIVSQRYIGDDTAKIADHAPRTWRYLQSHAQRFSARKSSIYKGSVPFALFGIGPYAFTPWKVAVSALHRSARFQVVGPKQGQPVFFDDACYYLSFDEEQDARLVAGILNSAACQQLLSSLIFPDAKRPLTVDLLGRMNLAALAEESGFAAEWRQMQQRSHADRPGTEQLSLVMEEPASPYRKSAKAGRS